MKQKKENRVALLLHWAGEQKIWLFLAIFLSAVSGPFIFFPFILIFRAGGACSFSPLSAPTKRDEEE